MKSNEIDCLVLTTDIPADGRKKADVCTIVPAVPGGSALLNVFLTLNGAAVAVFEVLSSPSKSHLKGKSRPHPYIEYRDIISSDNGTGSAPESCRGVKKYWPLGKDCALCHRPFAGYEDYEVIGTFGESDAAKLPPLECLTFKVDDYIRVVVGSILTYTSEL